MSECITVPCSRDYSSCPFSQELFSYSCMHPLPFPLIVPSCTEGKLYQGLIWVERDARYIVDKAWAERCLLTIKHRRPASIRRSKKDPVQLQFLAFATTHALIRNGRRLRSAALTYGGELYCVIRHIVNQCYSPPYSLWLHSVTRHYRYWPPYLPKVAINYLRQTPHYLGLIGDSAMSIVEGPVLSWSS